MFSDVPTNASALRYPPVSTGNTTLRVASRETAAENVVTLELVAPRGTRLPDWTPGAHIDLMLPNGLTRQYSLCGDRWDPSTYRVGVLLEPASAGGSSYVHHELSVGDQVDVGAPRNNFPLVPSDEYLFIAGGIGITPLLPMIQQANSLGANWSLLYGGQRRSSMAFIDELAPYGDRVRVTPEDELGRLNVSNFLGVSRPNTTIYACGPAGLLAAVEDACADWPPYALHIERFAASEPSAPVRDAPFEVDLARAGRSVTVTPDISVLEAVGQAGVQVLSSCRQGICGTCETAVVDGRIDHRDALLEDHERRANDRMYICVSRSLGARLVLDL